MNQLDNWDFLFIKNAFLQLLRTSPKRLRMNLFFKIPMYNYKTWQVTNDVCLNEEFICKFGNVFVWYKINFFQYGKLYSW